MKLYLEEETGTGEDKTISKIKEVQSKSEGKKGQYVHTCYHDEGNGRPCKREVL